MDILNKFVGRDLTEVTVAEIHILDQEIEKTYEDVVLQISGKNMGATYASLLRLDKLKEIKKAITIANRKKNMKINKEDLIEELYKKLDL